MSKYEIVELDSEEYTVRTKFNWFMRLLGFNKYHSICNIYITYGIPNSFTNGSLRECITLKQKLEERDFQNRTRKVIRVLND